MKKLLLVAVAFVFALGIAHPPAAEARVGVYANFGCCGGYGYGGYGGYYPYPAYPAYYYPYAVAPPPLVYAMPPPPPIVYAAPPAYAPPVYAAAPPAYAPASAPGAAANPGSPTFIDSQGRTCRQYQSTSGAQPSTACLQPDGTWRAVQ